MSMSVNETHLLLQVNNAGGGIPYTLHYPDLRSSQGNPVSVDYCYSLMVRAPWQLSGLFVDELIKNKGKS